MSDCRAEAGAQGLVLHRHSELLRQRVDPLSATRRDRASYQSKNQPAWHTSEPAVSPVVKLLLSGQRRTLASLTQLAERDEVKGDEERDDEAGK